MPNGVDSARDPRRQVPRPDPPYEIGKHSLGEAHDRVGFHLTGGPFEPSWSLGHTTKRFGSHEEALAYVEHHGLALKPPERKLPPSDAGDVGWAGR